MGFGAGLAFIAVGAILAFAVKWDVPGIDLQMIGWIFMGVGLVGMVLTSLYTRKPADEPIEVVEPDIMYTNDPPTQVIEPHVHVHRDAQTDPHADTGAPHLRRRVVDP
jgi:hypothetical protein